MRKRPREEERGEDWQREKSESGFSLRKRKFALVDLERARNAKEDPQVHEEQQQQRERFKGTRRVRCVSTIPGEDSECRPLRERNYL